MSSLFSRPLDLFFFVFFAIHIPVTIFSDAQPVYPESLKSKSLEESMRWWTSFSGDHLMKSALPGEKLIPWFTAILSMEVLFQLPYFFYALVGLWNDEMEKPHHKIPAVIYSSHVMTTVVPLLAEFAMSKSINTFQRSILLSVYGIFFLVPLLYLRRVTRVSTSAKIKRN